MDRKKVYLQNGKIYFNGDVENGSVENLISISDDFINSAPKGSLDYTLIIDSYGGEVPAGLKFIDYLNTEIQPNVKSDTCIAIGSCHSIATTIFSFFSKRLITPRAVFMLHELAGRLNGKLSHIRNSVDWYEIAEKQMIDIYTSATGYSEEKIREMISYDNYMTAEEAVKHGFAQKIYYGK